MARHRSKAVPSSPLLPSCPGPKLGAFIHQDAAIEWGRRLDVDRSDLSSTQASVFEVKIKSKVYALKVVRTHNDKPIYY